MQTKTWNDRRELLSEFQEKLLERFPEEDYNVFVFGSFVREDFAPESSDIDIIIYSKENRRISEVADFTKSYFDRIGLESDVLEYFYNPKAHVFLFGITNSVKLTAYYPQELITDLYYIFKDYRAGYDEQCRRKRYQEWSYLHYMNKVKGENKDGRYSGEFDRSGVQ